LLQGQDVDRPPEIEGGYATVEQTKSYPAAAEKDEAYGVIWLQCTVSASGVATRVQLAQGGHPALETEALNVIQRLEFSPATKGNAPVPARIQIPIIFQGPYAKTTTKQGG
jgi:TonB family protein